MTGRHGAHPSYNAQPENLAEAVTAAAHAAGIPRAAAACCIAAWLRTYNGPKRQRPLSACADAVDALLEDVL